MRVPAAPNPFLAACQRPFLASSTLRLQPLLKLLIRVLQKLQGNFIPIIDDEHGQAAEEESIGEEAVTGIEPTSNVSHTHWVSRPLPAGHNTKRCAAKCRSWDSRS